MAKTTLIKYFDFKVHFYTKLIWSYENLVKNSKVWQWQNMKNHQAQVSDIIIQKLCFINQNTE